MSSDIPRRSDAAEAMNREIASMIISKSRRQPRIFKVMVESMEDRLALDGSAAYIASVYEAVLDRAPKTAEVTSWTHQLQSGVSDATFATNLVQSPEHREIEVEDVFESILHEKADANSLNTYLNELEHGKTEEDVTRTLLDSTQFHNTHVSNTSFVQGVFQGVLGRSPSATELQDDVILLGHGTSRDSIVKATLSSSALEGEIVDKAFEEVLGRHDTETEHGKDVSDLSSGRLSDDNLLIELVASPENQQEHGGRGGSGGSSGKH